MSLWRKNSAKRLRVVRQISVYVKIKVRKWVQRNTGTWWGSGGDRAREEERVKERATPALEVT